MSLIRSDQDRCTRHRAARRHSAARRLRAGTRGGAKRRDALKPQPLERLEGMALNARGTKLYPLLEGTVIGDPAVQPLRISEFDLEREAYSGAHAPCTSSTRSRHQHR